MACHSPPCAALPSTGKLTAGAEALLAGCELGSVTDGGESHSQPASSSNNDKDSTASMSPRLQRVLPRRAVVSGFAMGLNDLEGLAPLSRLPRGVLGVVREIGRHLLKRPVVGICAVAMTSDGRVLLVRRSDTGSWALPGGTLEWGEQLSDALPREIEEETGARWVRMKRVTGVYSRPDRDPRFHAVTVCVLAEVAEPIRGPHNPVEIRDARLFAADELPAPLAMGMTDMLQHALEGHEVVLE